MPPPQFTRILVTNTLSGTSLVVQGFRICLAMQGAHRISAFEEEAEEGDLRRKGVSPG